MSNLNVKLKDAKWLDNLEKNFPEYFLNDSFLLHGSTLRNEIKCQATKCKFGEDVGKGQDVIIKDAKGNLIISNSVYFWIFCFVCNKSYHLSCIGHEVNEFKGKSRKFPWRCPTCKADENNEAATLFYELGEWDVPLDKRRESFMKIIDLSQSYENTGETDDPHDDVEQSLATKYEQQRQEFAKLAKKYNEIADQKRKESLENESLRDELKKMRSEFQILRSQVEGVSSMNASNVLNKKSDVNASSMRESIGLNANANNSIASSTRITGNALPVLTVDNLLSRFYLDENTSRRNNEARAEAPMPQQRRSFIQDINENDLSRSERINLEQVQAQLATFETQREISNTMNLDIVRKALPKISKFDGDAKNWIKFRQDVMRHKEVGKYPDDVLKLHVMQALNGLALARVQDIMDITPFDLIMKLLEESFGDPVKIIDKCSNDILSLKLSKELFKEDVMNINTKIQGYFSACKYAKVGYANSNQLARHIFDQLNLTHKQLFRHQFRLENPESPNKLIDLESLFRFLENLSKDLEDKRDFDKKSYDERKSKPAQVNVATVVRLSNNDNKDDFMYAIKDKNVSNLGYDLNALNNLNKFCMCCNKHGHFVVQCRKYKGMNGNEKLKFVIDKNICRNCLITDTHKSPECTLKNPCGMRINGEICKRKHHISLHRAYNDCNNTNRNTNRYNYNRRRNNTNSNQQRASNIINNQQPANTVAQVNSNNQTVSEVINQAPTISQLPRDQRQSVASSANGNATVANLNYGTHSNNIRVMSYSDVNQVLVLESNNVQRTVKVFRNKFLGHNGYVEGYSIGDSAAEVTLMSEDLREKLGLQGKKCKLSLQWTDGSLKSVDAIRVDLVVQGILKECEKITLKNCYAVPDLILPPRSLDIDKLKRKFPYLRKVKFDSYENVSPYLLIGSPHAAAIESMGCILQEGEGKPVGLKAKLGWSIYGGCPEEYDDCNFSLDSLVIPRDVHEPFRERVSNEELHELLSYFNSIETLGITNKSEHNTEEEQKALDIIDEEMKTLSDGSIELPLIWNRVNKRIPSIPNNFNMVYKRQLAHEAKLKKNPTHLKAFNDNFKELIEEGYVRAANEDDLYGNWQNINYLPMSLVINMNKNPPKFRTVFDASARFNGTSLNENLLKGPDLLIDLLKPLIVMRMNKIAFVADIKAMFMRMKINLRDQQCQRVIWRECEQDEMRVFIFTSMLFGPSCSPFASQYVKNHVADLWKANYPDAANIIKELMYMDDLLTSESSIDKAVAVAKQCIEIFDSINWKLVSFQSNCLKFMRALPECHVKQDMIPIFENESEACITKVLGCVWDTRKDCFIFNFNKNLFVKIVKDYNHRPTKRDQCSTIARIFDVLGLISHFIIRGKMLLQRSWVEGIGWDDQISEENFKLWMEWLNETENIAKLKIPRMFCDSKNLSQCDSIEMHTFCDAGGEAFAAVVYVVACVGCERYSNIIMSKAKVTPIRHKSRTQISEMPRLELLACLIAVRLAHTATKHMNGIKLKRFFWTDNVVALRWVTVVNQKLPKYAISPVEEILEKSDRCEWRYVPSKQNVADIATKFRKFDFGDSNSIWYKGPPFIRLKEDCWPMMPNLSEPPMVPDKRSVCSMNVKQVLYISTHKLPPIECKILNDRMIDTLSPSIKHSYPKLLRATARALKIWLDGLFPLLKSKKWNDKSVRDEIKSFHENFSILLPKDLERAEHFLVRKIQREVYENDYVNLRKNVVADNKEFKELNVFIDSEGLIRINSRVDLDVAVYPQKYAPLLPRRHWITCLILRKVHNDFNHIHIESQVAYLRSKFWIPQLLTGLKSTQFHCNFCSLARAKPYAPIMAPLPDSRINPIRKPFETTGLDCLGPFTILNYTRTKKIWILIFVCTLTRFIHLHILESLESTKVLEAISIFWAAHGPTKQFISDRGTNFVGASNIIQQEIKHTMQFLREQHSLLKQELVDKFMVEWKLLPAHSPWMGAFYERLIKEVKRSIAQVLNTKKLNKATLNIALHDAAHRINCRPLTHNSISADDKPVLTPHDLAKGRSGWPFLPGLPSHSSSDIRDDRSVYRSGRLIADEITRRFFTNYLPILTKRTKWFRDEKSLKVGDLVLIIEPNDTRNEWKRGVVRRLYSGRDGRSRVADVALPGGTIKKSRAIQRLAKIEIKKSEID